VEAGIAAVLNCSECRPISQARPERERRWVKLAQSIPVRIRLTDIPADVLISAGMTCTVTLKEGAEPLGPSETLANI
jgi:multidrug resistance efflux pump